METTLDATAKLYSWAKSRQAAPSDVWGVPWGFRGLDLLTGGIQQEELTVLGARPGVGKSAYAGQVVLNVARWLAENRPDEVVRVIHREMTAREFLLRLACQVARVPSKQLKRGKVTVEEMERLKATLKVIAALPIEIEAEPRSIDTTIDFLVGRTGDRKVCAWWMVDYLQIHPLSANARKSDPIETATTLMPIFRDISKKIPGMVLSQLTRDVDKRENHVPEASDLYGGTAVEANANVVMLLYRPDMYIQIPADKKDEPRFCHMRVAKNRSGESGTIDMLFNPPFGEFRDISKSEEQ